LPARISTGESRAPWQGTHSNIVERSMRPQVLTRKNALFAGHDDGAQNWAIVASLIETCKLGGVDPYSYLADVLFRLVNLWPNSRLDELLPWNWDAAKDQLQRAA
jgi:transposase